MNGCNQFNFCVCFAHGDLSCCLYRRKPPGENENHRFSWTKLILLSLTVQCHNALDFFVASRAEWQLKARVCEFPDVLLLKVFNKSNREGTQSLTNVQLAFTHIRTGWQS